MSHRLDAGLIKTVAHILSLNDCSKLLIFISKFAKIVRIFLASIQLSAHKKLPASENRPPGEKQQKESRNPRNNGLQLSFGTPERTLTSDLPLRSRAYRISHGPDITFRYFLIPTMIRGFRFLWCILHKLPKSDALF